MTLGSTGAVASRPRIWRTCASIRAYRLLVSPLAPGLGAAADEDGTVAMPLGDADAATGDGIGVGADALQALTTTATPSVAASKRAARGSRGRTWVMRTIVACRVARSLWRIGPATRPDDRLCGVRDDVRFLIVRGLALNRP